MDRISFEPQMFQFDIDDKETMTCKIIVNGEDFIETIKRIETPMAASKGEANIAGCYAYLPADELLEELNFEENDVEQKKAILLGCTCGSTECWPLYTQIEKREDVIIWHKFRNPYRDWDYCQIEPLMFDRKEYENELVRLESNI